MNKRRMCVRSANLICIALVAGGCSILTPYSSQFKCPEGDPGKCQSTRKTYAEALEAGTSWELVEPAKADGKKDEDCKDCKKQKKKDEKKAAEQKADSEKKGSQSSDSGIPAEPEILPATYTEMLLQRFSDSLEEPETPLVMPAQAVRILVLSYKGFGGSLFTDRYIYTFVDSPKWLLEETSGE